MKERKKIVYIDVDGTLIDFKKLDNYIISKIYSKNKIVKLLDKLLWWVNDFDIIGYSNFIFYARMCLYSIVSLKNVKKVLCYYELLYSKYVKEHINESLKSVLMQLEDNYQVIIVTRNMYAKCISDCIDLPVLVVKNKNTFYSKLYNNDNISYIIGNNYMDDIFSCYLLNMMYKRNKIKNEVTPIYIGKSKIVKWIVSKKTVCFKEFITCVNYLKNVVD